MILDYLHTLNIVYICSYTLLPQFLNNKIYPTMEKKNKENFRVIIQRLDEEGNIISSTSSEGKKIKPEDLILDDMSGLLRTFDEMTDDVLPVLMDAARRFEESQMDEAFKKNLRRVGNQSPRLLPRG